MRYLLRLLCVCALGVMPVVGCSGPYVDVCFENCPDRCEGVVCSDDGNECTAEFCRNGGCTSSPVDNGTDCTFDGAAGVCVDGECGENLCEDVVCEDDEVCTNDMCDYEDGTCYFPPTLCSDGNQCTEDSICNPLDGCTFTPLDGTICMTEGMPELGEVCEAGVCVAACDPASKEELPCPIEGIGNLVCCPGSDVCSYSCV